MFKRLMPVLFFLLLVSMQAVAQFTTDYILVEAPIGAKPASQVLWVKWTGVSRNPLDPTYLAPDSGRIYFDRSPGGGKLSNYRYKVTVPAVDSVSKQVLDNVYFRESPLKRGTAFRPADQKDMGIGVFYCVVAWPMQHDTLVSNEFQVIVESPNPVKWKSPSGSISNLTPTFTWDANPGVPYYHVILSDQPIAVDSSSGTINVSGLSVVWQAITPNTQITYGTPDPSKTLTATPPPFSPGKRYTWIVLNNYGNHVAFSSPKVSLPVGEFRVSGVPLKKPVNTYPVKQKLTTVSNPTFDFKWTNIDTLANSYRVNMYMWSEIQGMGGYMLVWETTVTNSAKKSTDTLKANINAAATLTGGRYLWNVIALDNKGAGTAGDTSSFEYAAPAGTMNICTREKMTVVQGSATQKVISPVGLVEVKVEVIQGPMEAPLAFYTDLDGNLSRSRPVGTYRVTAVKSGFEQSSKTVVITDKGVSNDTLYLTRPEATMYGKVSDKGGKPVNLASVIALSEYGDSIQGFTDALGNFSLNCKGADWTYRVEKAGYKSSTPVKITLTSGQNYSCGTTVIEENPYILSGIVKNSDGDAIIGVKLKLMKDGVTMDEVPSTPQSGAFSFSVPTGTYTIIAEKAGFSSYNSSLIISGSRTLNITLSPGAALVNGSIVGETWVGTQFLSAAIPSARVKFTDVSSPSDTFVATSDATFGQFSLSLPGNRTFLVSSSAPGYSNTGDGDTIVTVPKSTISFQDTLRSLAVISGKVKMMDGTAEGNVNIVVYDAVQNKIIATTKSLLDGYYEIKGIPDGVYEIKAGRDGLFLDSLFPGKSLLVADGKPEPASHNLFMSPGSKTLKFQINGYSGSGSIKILSPVVKTVAFKDSLTSAGPGVYNIEADAVADSIIDLSYRSFTLADTVISHSELISFPVVHISADTLKPVAGQVTLKIKSAIQLDSAAVFFRNEGVLNYSSLKNSSPDSVYQFLVTPGKDGCKLFYYFKAYKGKDVYGYSKQLFNTFVKPDSTVVSRFEIIPASSDESLILPASYSAAFEVRAFYSSSFIPFTNLKPDGITWSLSNASGCRIETLNSGLGVTVKTSSSSINEPVLLIATVDTSKIKIASGISKRDTVKFLVSGSELHTISVERIDFKAPNPVTTSGYDVAEFRAIGKDAAGNEVAISPQWSIQPSSAGTISKTGSFKPARNFVGRVRVIASNGIVSGEYQAQNKALGILEAGLCVLHMLSHKATADTSGNLKGMRVIFPPNAIGEGDFGLLDVSLPDMRNQMKRGYGERRMVDSIAYDITQLSNISLNLSVDSIRLILDIPEKMRKEAALGTKQFWIARWNDDSLKWVSLPNSKISSDGKTVSAGLTHFSRYAIVSQPGELEGSLSVSPNPFSPYIRPVKEYGADAPFGTCIKFRIEAPEERVPNVKMHIYTATGQRVWAVEMLNVAVGEHRVWWNGKTNNREEVWNPELPDGGITYGSMCRNGRYFVMIVIRDIKGKEVKYMKPVVLMK